MSIIEVLCQITTHNKYFGEYHFSEDNIQMITIGDIAVGEDGEYHLGALVKTNASVLIIYDLTKFDDHAILPNIEMNIHDMIAPLQVRLK